MLTLRKTATRPENPARVWQWQTDGGGGSSEQPVFTSSHNPLWALRLHTLATYGARRINSLNPDFKNPPQKFLCAYNEEKSKRKVQNQTCCWVTPLHFGTSSIFLTLKTLITLFTEIFLANVIAPWIFGTSPHLVRSDPHPAAAAAATSVAVLSQKTWLKW